MPVAAGTKLGPYEVLAPLGAGGMGEVYRARDTRLGRDVAIKVLPQHLSNNPDLRARFEREAKTISQLSHAHICALYDVGHQEGVDFLVLELLEGESLAERLARGELPLEQTLAYGMEIGEALETAHRSGIIHRDLKPGNIMLTKSGVKLLDFGLAKPAASAAGASAFGAMTASHPSQPLTAEGAIVGTFQYLPPEQIEGQEADARGDIFALGCVLYEMATGRRAFGGKTQASIVASILAAEPPPISSLRPLTPPAFERVVKICLAKEPEERWQTAHDVRLQLKWIAEAGSQAGVPAPLVARRRLHQRTAWAVAALALLLAAASTTALLLRSGENNRSLQASLLPPKDYSFAPTDIEISPDASRIAFVAIGKDGKSSLWVRSLNSLASQQLAGTEDAHYPFWSPDSRAIGFFADGKLRKIDAGGGPVVALADAPQGRGGAWSKEGVIIFSPKANLDGLYEVPSAGGAVVEVQHVEKARSEDEFRWPFFMPDGRHFTFYVLSTQTTSGGNQKDTVGGIYFAELGGKTRTRLLNADTAAKYADGHLFYLAQRNLMAQPFNPSTGAFTGAAFPVAQQVEFNAARFIGAFSASPNGALEYLAGEAVLSKMAWVDRTGKAIAQLATGGTSQGVALSPDGARMATAVLATGSSNYDVWVYDLGRGIGTRITSDGSDHNGAIWGRDGQSVFYESDASGTNLYSRAGSGLGPEEKVVESGALKFPNDWSPDGKALLYMNFVGPGGIPQLWIHEAGSGKKDYALLKTNFVEAHAQFSPDGRWLTYSSNESGRYEVEAISYPSLATKVQISANGGLQARWRRDGKEIFYIAPDSKMMAVTVTEKGSGLDVGPPQTLFDSKIFQIFLTLHQYDVAGDGQKFLINTRPEAVPEPATIYANWQADFKK